MHVLTSYCGHPPLLLILIHSYHGEKVRYQFIITSFLASCLVKEHDRNMLN